MHRLASDEVFHFYLGDPVRMLHLYPDGSARELLLGPDLDAGMLPQVVVPAGVWQGARLASSAWPGARPAPGGEDAASFALLGTTVAPGFEFEDFELGTRDDLMAAYPGYAEPIRALTPEPPAAAPPATDAEAAPGKAGQGKARPGQAESGKAGQCKARRRFCRHSADTYRGSLRARARLTADRQDPGAGRGPDRRRRQACASG